MRIVIVTSRFPEPSQPFVSDKALALARMGHDVVVVADAPVAPAGPLHRVEVRYRPTNRHELASALRAAHARDSAGLRTALEIARSRRGSSNELGWLAPLLDRRADIVDFEWLTDGTRSLPYLDAIRCPIVVTCHGSDLRVSPLESEQAAAQVRTFFATASRIRCVSHELAERATELGARPEQLVVLPVGADVEFFGRYAGSPHNGPLRLVSVGRLHWVKGYEYALAAVRQLVDDGVEVRYTIVGGDDGGGGQVRLAIRDLGLGEVVRLTGHIDRTATRAMYAISDIFLLPSVSEGASTATLEALAMGLPAIATDAGGTAELFEDGVHGLLVPPRSAEALAVAIRRLADPELRTALGTRAAEHVRRHFDARVQLDRLVGVYEELTFTRRATVPAEQLVSVVIPVRNSERTIDEQLRALAYQRYAGEWEVVVADNGSTDRTRERVLAWAGKLPHLRVVDASQRRGPGHARNIGVRAAAGRRIVLCDADDVVAPGWLDALAAALEDAALVGGPVDPVSINPPRLGFARADDGGPRIAEGFKPMVATSNMGFRREVFDAVGGFDAALRRGSDMDFAWRAQRAGFEPRWIPGAVVHYRGRSDLRDVARQAFGDGLAAPALYVRHRNAGLRAPSRAAVMSRYRDLVVGLPRVAVQREPRHWWVYDTAQATGRVVGSARHRVPYF